MIQLLNGIERKEYACDVTATGILLKDLNCGEFSSDAAVNRVKTLVLDQWFSVRSHLAPFPYLKRILVHDKLNGNHWWFQTLPEIEVLLK